MLIRGHVTSDVMLSLLEKAWWGVWVKSLDSLKSLWIRLKYSFLNCDSCWFAGNYLRLVRRRFDIFAELGIAFIEALIEFEAEFGKGMV